MAKKIIVAILLLIFFILAFLIMDKKIRFNLLFAHKYEIRGVDVSHYQGDIDWGKMADENIEFAYIKATEGSSHVDEKFHTNWEDIAQTDLYCGAYHDFIEGAFNEYDLWIRNVYYTPDIGMKGCWLYWQYTDRTKFDAYTGEEQYIDMNVFVGSRTEFLNMLLPSEGAKTANLTQYAFS